MAFQEKEKVTWHENMWDTSLARQGWAWDWTGQGQEGTGEYVAEGGFRWVEQVGRGQGVVRALPCPGWPVPVLELSPLKSQLLLPLPLSLPTSPHFLSLPNLT